MGKRVKPESIEQVIEEGLSTIASVYHDSEKITDKSVREGVVSVCIKAKTIFDRIVSRPSAAKIARSFLTYYNDAFLDIVRKYQGLTRHNESLVNEKPGDTSQIVTLLTQVSQGYDKLLAKLVQPDLTDLEVDMELLSKTLKSDGLLG